MKEKLFTVLAQYNDTMDLICIDYGVLETDINKVKEEAKNNEYEYGKLEGFLVIEQKNNKIKYE